MNVGAEDVTAPYAIQWDTRGELNGSHTLTAIARDTSGNTRTSSSVTVTVANAGVSQAGLRVAYGLDETSGTAVADWSGANNTATAVGTTWTSGRFGNAASFDGVSDRIDVPALGTFYNTAFTLEAWVRKSTNKKDVAVLGSWTTSGGPMIWIDHANGRYHLALSGNPSDYLDSGRTPTIGQWEHVAATYDGNDRPLLRRRGRGREQDVHRRGRQLEHVAARRLQRNALRLLRRTDGQRARLRPGAHRGRDRDSTWPPASSARRSRRSVTATTPANGAAGVNAGTTPTARFNEPMKASTITTSTFQLKDAAQRGRARDRDATTRRR